MKIHLPSFQRDTLDVLSLNSYQRKNSSNIQDIDHADHAKILDQEQLKRLENFTYSARIRRSPCLDTLTAACRDLLRPSGEHVVAGLMHAYSNFFQPPYQLDKNPVQHYRGNIDDTLEYGIASGFLEEKAELPPHIISGSSDQMEEVLLHARGSALRKLSDSFADNSSVGSSPATSRSRVTSVSGVNDFSTIFDLEINQALAEELTGYPSENPADIIRKYGARLINERLITKSQLQTIVTHASSEPIFLGSWIPPEAIGGILQDQKYIWKRPLDRANSTNTISNTRFEKILNITISPDENVRAAQEYVYRKHPAITDNYILHLPDNAASLPRLERSSPTPAPPRLPDRIGINIIGPGDSPDLPFGETTFEDFSRKLAELIQRRRFEGEISPQSNLTINFVNVDSITSTKISSLHNIFREYGLQPPTVNPSFIVEGNGKTVTDLDFIISLSPEQAIAQLVRQFKAQNPTAVIYNFRRSGPNVRTGIFYRQIPWLSPIPPQRVRINVFGHGNISNSVGNIAVSDLAPVLAKRIREGQLTGEFNVDAKIALNFVSCKISLSNDILSDLHQKFKNEKIQLSEIHVRTGKVLVDTAGRKLQQQEKGNWVHGHRKQVYLFNNSEVPQAVPMSTVESSDIFTLRDAAGPLLMETEMRHHIDEFTKELDFLKKENNLSEEWRPDLSSLTKTAESQYRINFSNKQQVVTVITNRSRLEQFNKLIKEHSEVVSRQHSLEYEKIFRPIITSQERGIFAGMTVSSLNRLLASMSALRMLIDARNSLNGSYSNEIREHALINLAQSIHTLGNDGLEMGNSLRALFINGSRLSETQKEISAIRFMKGVNRLVGRGLMAANIGFDIYELSQAKTTEEKLRAGVALGLDGTFVGLEIAALAGIPGVGELTLLLGLSLLAVELGEWLYDQHVTHDDEVKIYRYFESLEAAYGNSFITYRDQDDVLQFAPHAVITSIALDDQPFVQFDSQKLIARDIRDKTSNMKLGSFVNRAVYYQESGRVLNIGSEMGWPERKLIPQKAATATTIILPVSPATNLYYEYKVSNTDAQLRQSRGAQIVRKLAQVDTNLQHQKCTRTISALNPVLLPTQINVKLGKRDRSLLMPPNLPQEIEKSLKYILEGAGGTYKLSPTRNAEFILSESPGAASNWIIDLSSLDKFEDLNYSLTSDTLTFQDAIRGPVKIHFAGIRGEIEIHSNVRRWRLDRETRQMRLTYMDFGGNKPPEGQATQLRSEIESQFNAVGAPQLPVETKMETNRETTMARALIAAFRNRGIALSNELQLDNLAIRQRPQTVILDVPLRKIITVGTDKLSDAQYAGRTGSGIYFSRGRLVWKGSELGKPSSPEQSLFFEQGRNHIIRVWNQGNADFISQIIPLEKRGDRVEAIYRIDKNGKPVLIRLAVRSEEFRRRNHVALSASEAFRAIEEIVVAPRVLLSSALITTAIKSNMISLSVESQRGDEERFWLDRVHDQLVPLDDRLPADALPLANTKNGEIFFYSETTRKLYRRENSLAKGSLFLTGVQSLKMVEERLQVTLDEGITYEITSKGNKRVIAIGAPWMNAHRLSWIPDFRELLRDREFADSVVIEGLKLPDGKNVLCWYDKDQNQFTVASTKFSNTQLRHLGAVTSGSGAWMFQADTGHLYQQPTFTAEWMNLLLNYPDKALLATQHLAQPTSVLPQERFDRVTCLYDGRIIGRTLSGMTLLIEPGMTNRPLVLAVNSHWMSWEKNHNKHLVRLSRDEDYRFHWNIDLPSTNSERGRLLNWYDVAAEKIISVPKEKLTDQLDYVGYSISNSVSYFGNSGRVSGFHEYIRADQSSKIETEFKYPNRDKNILSLYVSETRISRNILPPSLVGVNTLILQGNIDGLQIDQELWDHHRLILLNRLTSSQESLQKADRVTLQFPGAENLKFTRIANDLALESLPGTPYRQLIFKDFFAPGKNWNISFELPNGIQKNVTSENASL